MTIEERRAEFELMRLQHEEQRIEAEIAFEEKMQPMFQASIWRQLEWSARVGALKLYVAGFDKIAANLERDADRCAAIADEYLRETEDPAPSGSA